MDFGDIFQRFWWLVFPVLWMIWSMVDLAGRHKRARHGMDLIKSYIDQGKEPPPELLKILSNKDDGKDCKSRGHSWTPVFLFAVLSAAFLWAAYLPDMEFEPKQIWALHLVAAVFCALCLGSLVNALRQDRNKQ